MNEDMIKQKEFVIYQATDGSPKIEVRLENENIWLTQTKIAELFCVERSGTFDFFARRREQKNELPRRKQRGIK